MTADVKVLTARNEIVACDILKANQSFIGAQILVQWITVNLVNFILKKEIKLCGQFILFLNSMQ